MLILNEIGELSVEEEDLLNSGDADDTPIPACSGCNLYEARSSPKRRVFFNILPRYHLRYSIDEFTSHVVISKSNIRIFPSFQALSRA